MTDTNDPNTNAPDEDLASALANLAEFVKPMTNEAKINLDAYYYLLLLWASFQVYPLEPPPETSTEKAKIIPLENGWKVYDYGDYLSVSAGENYGSYCTGKLIDSAIQMIDLLHQRGVTKVGFLGHDIARRAAWIECVEHDIAIINYEASDFDKEVRYRIIEARKAAEKTRKKIPPAQRLELE